MAQPQRVSQNASSRSPSAKKAPVSTVTVPEPFNLLLESRIERRRQFDEGIKQRLKQAEEQQRLADEQRKREEEEEIKKYRDSLCFKANPVQQYPGITISASPRSPTIPVSPQHHQRDRKSVV